MIKILNTGMTAAALTYSKMIWHTIGRLSPLVLGTVSFLVMFSSLSLCIGLLGFHFHNIHKDTRQNSIKTIARYAISLIDPEKHHQLVQEPQRVDLQKSLLEPLVYLHKQLPNVHYLYTMVQIEGRKYFVLDTSDYPLISVGASGTAYSVMEEYTDYNESLHWMDDLQQGKIHIDPEPVQDAFGTWITVSVPLLGPDGHLMFWLGMDFDAQDYLEKQNEVQRDVIITLIIGSLLSLLAAIVMGLSQHHIHRLQKARKLQTITDPLTGAYNRRYLKGQSDKIWQNFRIKKSLYAVMVMDIDHFKQINDGYGHDVGDLCLIKLVEALKTSLRGDDHLIRMGGEEFLIIFPQLNDYDALCRTAERFRVLIEELSIELENGSALNFTVSIGVAQSELYDKSLEGTIKRADKHLYRAKADGRNRVISQGTD